MCDRDQKPQFNSIHLCLFMAACSLAFTTRHALAADPTPPGFLGRIAALDGKIYDKATLEKVDPDGLLVVFVPVEGGSGSAKLKFRNLPTELQERFGYDPARASDYETARARGEALWHTDNALWTEQRWAAQAEQATWERQMRAQTELRLAAEAEQARLEAARNVQEPAYYYPLWWGSGNYWWGSGNHKSTLSHPKPAFHSNHISQRVPAGSCPISRVSPTIRPMRPFGNR
jgi:hypothetical protein